jgi:hypothetical protein
MSGTWRERHGASIVSKGDVVGYLQSPLASLTVASRGRKGDPRTVAVSVGEQLKLRFDEPGGLDE